jgi:5'-nucleotidase
MVATAKRMSTELRDPRGEHRCDIIIALTHCRLPNDIDLANDLGATKSASSEEHGVDLVLGGHDHTYYIGKGVDDYRGEHWETDMPGLDKDADCLIVKSGTDFHDLSEIKLEISKAEEDKSRRRRIVGVKVERHSTKPSDPTLPELKAHIDDLMERVDKATGQPVAFSLTPLDCRMGQVRTEESATGNLIADILMHSYGQALRDRDRHGALAVTRPEGEREVDMTLICGGSLRGDAVFGPGSE